MSERPTIAVLGPGRIGRQIALAFALGGCRVRLVDVKEGRPAAEAARTLADAHREITRDVSLMVEERVIGEAAARQVADATIGLTHNNSGMGEHVVMIYGKEPA